MTKKTNLKETNDQVSKHQKLYINTPIWKSLLIMAFPSMIMMLTFGSYFFFDNVLSINMASDSYNENAIPGLTASSMIRIFMNGYGPINALMMAFAMLLGVGVSTRVAINLGRKDITRAKNTLRTGFMVGMIFSFVITPILIFSAKPWIASQYKAFDPQSLNIIQDEAFKYALPIIATYPIAMFGQMLPSLLRVEARNKQMLVATTIPIFINLGLDALFMGPAGMGVEGGAWATVIANSTTAIILGIFIYKSKKDSIIKYSILFGWKFKFISIFGIILVGIAPFLRNMSQSVTGSVQNGVFNDVSAAVFRDNYIEGWRKLAQGGKASTEIQHILETMKNNPKTFDAFNGIVKAFNPTNNTGVSPSILKISDSMQEFLSKNDFWKNIHGANINNLQFDATYQLFMNPQTGMINKQATPGMISIISGAMPVFALFFPVMFSLSQAARPIASFNYGAKNYKRVRKTYMWTIIYANIAGVIIYFLVAWGISGSLIDLLNVKNTPLLPEKDLSIKALKIIMLTMIGFSFAIGGMTVFGSTDRIIMSTISSALQGLILFWPIIFLFKDLALSNVNNDLILMWFWPVSGIVSSIFITIMVIGTLYNIDKKEQMTLDERIKKIYDWRNKKIESRKARKVNKK